MVVPLLSVYAIAWKHTFTCLSTNGFITGLTCLSQYAIGFKVHSTKNASRIMSYLCIWLCKIDPDERAVSGLISMEATTAIPHCSLQKYVWHAGPSSYHRPHSILTNTKRRISAGIQAVCAASWAPVAARSVCRTDGYRDSSYFHNQSRKIM